MSKTKENFYYCEICGDQMRLKDTKELWGHKKCVTEIKDFLKLMRKVSKDIKGKQVGDFNFDILRLLVKLKINELEKSKRSPLS